MDGDRRRVGRPTRLDDRLALLFVACDQALSPTSQMVLALRVVCGLDVRRSPLTSASRRPPRQRG